jgi:hypothetical protein
MISNDIITELDKFTCEIYGIKRNTNADKQPTVNDARYQMFCEKYDSKKRSSLSLKLKELMAEVYLLENLHSNSK